MLDQQAKEPRHEYQWLNLNDQPNTEHNSLPALADNEFQHHVEGGADADKFIGDEAKPFYGPQLLVQEQNNTVGLGRIVEQEEPVDMTETEVNMALGGKVQSLLNPLGLNFGPDLQRFDLLELN